jgi:deoxyribodipyrimidine photo-lyase
MSVSVALVWFRRDLRLQDQLALQAALDAGHEVVPVYIHAPHEEGEWAPGAASDAWRHRSLAALDADLRTRVLAGAAQRGDSLPTLQALIEQTGAEAVYWNRKYEPATQPRDATIKRTLREGQSMRRAAMAAFCSSPGTSRPSRDSRTRYSPRTGATCSATGACPHRRPPRRSCRHTRSAASRWTRCCWRPRWTGTPASGSTGSRVAGALEALSVFEDGALRGYREQRDLPDRVGTPAERRTCISAQAIAPWRIAHALEGCAVPAPTLTSMAT